ncbi:hypothetical protein ACIBKY_03845 [Nonomuraea sp. NPDC050394]|uniref:hypothetical protein n=1 Tax=Nonomuraea sp. NPDC050394 TaxID=3364363 RepID=UPI00378768A8
MGSNITLRGVVDEKRAIRLQARRVMSRYAYRDLDPVMEADRRTSMNDARTALCLALGIAEQDIDPASGHDYSAEAYESVRASWRYHARHHGLSRFYDGPAYRRAIDSWQARRPDLAADGWVGPLESWARD